MRRFAILMLVAQSLLWAKSTLLGQEGLLHGRVVLASDTSIAVPRARITFTTAGGHAVTVFADDDGRFSIKQSQSPQLEVTVSRTGFVAQTITLVPSLPLAPLEIRLTEGGVIRGQALDVHGAPAVGVAVRIAALSPRIERAASPLHTIAYTDDLGQFRAAGLAPGQYEVSTFTDSTERTRLRTDDLQRVPGGFTFHGSALPVHEATPPPSRPVLVEVQNGRQHVIDLQYAGAPLEPPDPSWTAAIEGRLLDARGQPAEDIKVRLWNLVPDGLGRRAWQLGPAQTTDDLGRFRLFHVQPGAYIVEAIASDSWRFSGTNVSSLAPLYYPGVTVINQSLPVTVSRGQVLTDVSMVFLQQQLARVHGSASAASGMPLEGTVTLVSKFIAGAIHQPPREVITRDGAFEFNNVGPGEYVIRAIREQVDATPVVDEQGKELGTRRSVSVKERGYYRIAVDEADLGPLTIATAPPSPLLGRVTFEGAEPPAMPVSLSLRPADRDFEPPGLFSQSSARVAPDGRFELPGFGVSSYLTYLGPPGWYIRSIRAPVALAPVDTIEPWVNDVTVVLSAAMASVSGHVVTPIRSTIRPDVVLIVEAETPRNKGSRPVRTAQLAVDGHFTFRDLVPGNYDILAVERSSLPTASAELRATFESFGRRITLRPNENLTLTLQPSLGNR